MIIVVASVLAILTVVGVRVCSPDIAPTWEGYFGAFSLSFMLWFGVLALGKMITG